ncbi:MAG: 23S rRNA (uracil(1939)-C(5))-methyltransferase RlmD [Erysipelotrichaceae bacterium]|nr:23S rRNA (uracil(1939)-C(5))-methyltransferase RlmD [Erysipelotrichaceae bacterium]
MKKCPVCEFCGGCQYQGMSYQDQLERKQKYVKDLLGDFHNVEKITPMEEPENYRNKMQISFTTDDHHNMISGYYVPSSHMIVPVSYCMLCDDGINRIYDSVKKILIKYKVSVYDERSKRGCIRHLLIRLTNLNEYMVVLVTGSMNLMKQDLILRDILKYNPEVKTIIHNINNRNTSAILGNRSNVLYGKGFIIDELCGLKFKISAESFFQVNKSQTERLYLTALKLADLKENEVLIDAYCGTGTIGMVASRYVRKVIGVESNQSAVKDSISNKTYNKIKNIEFICDDAGRYMEKVSKTDTRPDIVIMDPPRGGSSIKFMSSMVKMSPEKIVYISCNPETLKRDIQYLTRFYKITKIQPVDMFPYTQHVETIVLLYKLQG